MPTSRVTRCPVSSRRVLSGCHASAPSSRASLRDHHAGLLGRRAGAALLGAGPGRGAVDAEPAARQRGLEHDARDHVVAGVVGAQPLGAGAIAGDVAVEREADGVEDAGLAGAGRAAEQEQPRVGQRVEVDRRPGRRRGRTPTISSWWSLIGAPTVRGADQHVLVGVVAAGVDGLPEQVGLRGGGRDAAHVADEVEGDRVVAACRVAGPRRRRVVGSPGRGTAAPGCAGSGGAAAPSPGPAGGRR